MFAIEDEMHSEVLGEYPTFDEALGEVKKISSIPWGEGLNRSPCQSWKTCVRNYFIIEYDTSTLPWSTLKQTPVLEVSENGVKWDSKFGI